MHLFICIFSHTTHFAPNTQNSVCKLLSHTADHRKSVLQRASTAVIEEKKQKRRLPAWVRLATHVSMFVYMVVVYLLVLAYGLRAAVHREECFLEEVICKFYFRKTF